MYTDSHQYGMFSQGDCLVVLWKQYILSFIACVFSCGMIVQILPNSKRKTMIQLAFRTALVVILLQPLSGITLEKFLPISSFENDSAERYIYDGERAALEAKKEYIKSSCEAYILSRAEQLGYKMNIQISLDENLLPVSAEIEGSLQENEQSKLQNILTDDLGIPKENQLWTWNQENNTS